MSIPQIFDKAAQARNQQRVRGGFFASHDVLHQLAQERMLERLSEVQRAFPRVLIEGRLAPSNRDEFLLSLTALKGAQQIVEFAPENSQPSGQQGAVNQESLPFAAQSFDLIISQLSLHGLNDVPGFLAQIRMILAPGGLFLGTLFGQGSLAELRSVLQEAEMAQRGGAYPRVHPLPDLRDMAGLLQRVGFALPVADEEMLRLSYPDFLSLLDELRGMGEANALQQRCRHFTPRWLFQNAADLYAARHTAPEEDEGTEAKKSSKDEREKKPRLLASVSLITLTGWRD